eukprot:Skav210457  [mRNA]  locus=scaffold1297:296952:298030:+ [translate_table: standard]
MVCDVEVNATTEAPESAEPRSDDEADLENQAPQAPSAPSQASKKEASGERWRPIGRAPLPGEVIRFRVSDGDSLTDFQVAQCVGAGMAAGVSQVTLQGSGGVWSTPVHSLAEVHLGVEDNPRQAQQKLDVRQDANSLWEQKLINTINTINGNDTI